ncbi:hypothetical protein [Planifilum fimeticola]
MFLRERRQMAFSLLHGDEATSSKEPLDTLARRRAVLAALGYLLLVAIGALLNAHSLSSDTAYFAGLINDLAEWWKELLKFNLFLTEQIPMKICPCTNWKKLYENNFTNFVQEV